MAISIYRPGGDASNYLSEAEGLAKSNRLDFLDIVGDDGSVISSKEWQAHFGYKMEWVTAQRA